MSIFVAKDNGSTCNGTRLSSLSVLETFASCFKAQRNRLPFAANSSPPYPKLPTETRFTKN
jgi:hypothetical protein